MPTWKFWVGLVALSLTMGFLAGTYGPVFIFVGVLSGFLYGSWAENRGW